MKLRLIFLVFSFFHFLILACGKPLQVYEDSGILHGIVDQGTINLYALYVNDNSKVDAKRIKLEGFHKGRFSEGEVWKCNLDQLGTGFGDVYVAIEHIDSSCEPQIYHYHSSCMFPSIFFCDSKWHRQFHAPMS